jgi:hypothetical protein
LFADPVGPPEPAPATPARPGWPTDNDPVAVDATLLGALSILMPQVSQKSVAADSWPSGHTAMAIAAISWF